jgi:hypothetical protein
LVALHWSFHAWAKRQLQLWRLAWRHQLWRLLLVSLMFQVCLEPWSLQLGMQFWMHMHLEIVWCLLASLQT